MIQGTGSSVGKSMLVAGLCRIFKQDGFRVVPFKAQNMALNSFVTREGLEMGRAQAAQAEACGVEPSVLMNPVLLKPSSDRTCQVIVLGRVYGNLSAKDYQQFKPKLLEVVKESYEKLAAENDIVVIEGAGSPAEINLKDCDIANMGVARMVNAPVLLVGDIDRGGVFAALAGTMLLLTEEEKELVKGVIINKFRGDLDILKPGIRMLEDIIKRPVLGVVPYTDVYIDDEDSCTERFRSGGKAAGVTVKVLRLPHISNFTDFEALARNPHVSLSYVEGGTPLGEADAIILPGTKNTLGDLQAVRQWGWDRQIRELARKGAVVFGICGGFQMLGRVVRDPNRVEGDIECAEGLGLLEVYTEIKTSKVTTQVEGKVLNGLPGCAGMLGGSAVRGYEIHMGDTQLGTGVRSFISLKRCGSNAEVLDGAVSPSGNVLGTYVHGIFDSAEFTSKFVRFLGDKKGLHLDEYSFDFNKYKESEYDRWADVVRESLDLRRIYSIIGIK